MGVVRDTALHNTQKNYAHSKWMCVSIVVVVVAVCYATCFLLWHQLAFADLCSGSDVYGGFDGADSAGKPHPCHSAPEALVFNRHLLHGGREEVCIYVWMYMHMCVCMCI